MVDKIEELMKAEHRTRSELLREALRRYVEEYEWRKQFRRAEISAKETGLSREQVDGFIDALRTADVNRPSRMSNLGPLLPPSGREDKGKKGRSSK
jgi:CopG family transcriptional regulator/antitoxin EndoAI